MRTKKIILVAAENAIIKSIQNAIKNTNYSIQAVVSSNKKAVEEIEKNRPEIILMELDIKGKIKGLESAELIKKRYDIPIIFIFNPEDQDIINNIKTTELQGYLLKPLKAETLENELKAAIEIAIYKHGKEMLLKKENELYISLLSGKDKHDGIFVRANYRLNHIKYTDIIYVEAFKDYVVIHTADESFTTHATMKEMVRTLPPREFARVHRSHIIKLDKIINIKYPDMLIEGKKTKIQVGGMYRKDLYRRLNIL
ncbi:MAG: response regulator transcription factor [Bacteroidales bacterium]|nr:response regulator transcription factor [Bacteroidales bacterium]